MNDSINSPTNGSRLIHSLVRLNEDGKRLGVDGDVFLGLEENVSGPSGGLDEKFVASPGNQGPARHRRDGNSDWIACTQKDNRRAL